MRPIKLKLTAFGPFPKEEIIDFQELGQNPLFLINGPTGSGKTTLLDAICFALYGKSTGDEREAPQMRSDLAAPEQLAEVDFIFDLAGKRYRIIRSPEQQRPKARGEGFTDQKARADFYQIPENGEEQLIVAKKVKEATAEIEALTGLNADQFRQVMVLPQGKFRQLLMAESKDREVIFSRLFQTSIYKKLEDQLKSQAKKVRDAVKESQQVYLGILNGAELESLEELESEFNALKPQCKQELELKQKSETAFLTATQNLQEAKSLFSRFAQLENSQKEQTELIAKKEVTDKKRKQISLAEASARISPSFQEKHRCEKELQEKKERLNEANLEKTKAEEVKKVAEEKMQSIESLEKACDGFKQELVRFNEYQGRAADLTKAVKVLKKVEQADEKLLNTLKESKEKLQQVESSKTQSEKTLVDLQKRITTLPDVKLAYKGLTDHLSARQEFDVKQNRLLQQEGNLSDLENRGKKLKDQDEQLDRETKALELKWHQGQAAYLASELQPGNPCPVCGSLEHPNPTVSKDTIPTEKELADARKKRESHRQLLTGAREEYKGIKATVAALKEEVEESQKKLGELLAKPLEQVVKEISDLEAELKHLEKSQKQLESLQSSISKLKEEESTLRNQVDEIQQQSIKQKSEVAAAQTRLQQAQSELPEEFREEGVLQKLIHQKQSELSAKEAEISAIRKQYDEANTRWSSAEASSKAALEANTAAAEYLKKSIEEWQDKLESSPFETESVFRDALLDDEALNLLKQEVEAFDNRLNQLEGAIKQQRSALADQVKPNLETFEKALNEKEQEKIEADLIWQKSDKRLSLLANTRKKLEQSKSGQEELEKEYAVIGTLSDVANGLTGNKISLQRFVLSVLLDDVLIEASRRLQLMTKGRFRLLRKEDRAKGNKASGLDLEVEDSYSGKVRPVATLSGGESFMAALAMALGLSEVVQAYAGGIKLDTLFIDEGFGSLDPEALDLAIRTLIDLQSSGRMIGIISHVTDLKEQIKTRLDVIADRNGSTVKMVVP